MKMSYVVYAAMAASILLVASAIGLLQSRVPSAPRSASMTGVAPSKQKLLERRRGAIGTAAVAGTTVQ